MELNLSDGEYLVKFARKIIEGYYERKNVEIDREIYKKYSEKRGVFVTIETYPEKELRGCIGYSEPIFPLIEAIKDVALQAALNDPRFPPLEKEELNNVIIEVTVLTPPQLIEAPQKNYEDFIEIGKDGLIVEKGFNKGLLLPQVPVEWNWNKKEFLQQACIKAGLPKDAYLDKTTKIYKFQGKIFSEVSPNGKVIIREFKSCQ